MVEITDSTLVSALKVVLSSCAVLSWLISTIWILIRRDSVVIEARGIYYIFFQTFSISAVAGIFIFRVVFAQTWTCGADFSWGYNFSCLAVICILRRYIHLYLRYKVTRERRSLGYLGAASSADAQAKNAYQQKLARASTLENFSGQQQQQQQDSKKPVTHTAIVSSSIAAPTTTTPPSAAAVATATTAAAPTAPTAAAPTATPTAAAAPEPSSPVSQPTLVRSESSPPDMFRPKSNTLLAHHDSNPASAGHPGAAAKNAHHGEARYEIPIWFRRWLFLSKYDIPIFFGWYCLMGPAITAADMIPNPNIAGEILWVTYCSYGQVSYVAMIPMVTAILFGFLLSRYIREVVEGFEMLWELRIVIRFGSTILTIWFLLVMFDGKYGLSGIAYSLAICVLTSATGFIPIYLSYHTSAIATSKTEKEKITLKDILSNIAMKAAFTEFLCTEFCIENLICFDDIVQFKSRPSPRPIEEVLVIYEKFFALEGQYQVNLPDDVSSNLRKKLTNPQPSYPVTVFDEAHQVVHDLLMTTIVRFKASDSYKKYDAQVAKELAMATVDVQKITSEIRSVHSQSHD